MYCKALHKSAVHPSIDFSYEDEEVNPDPIAQSATLPASRVESCEVWADGWKSRLLALTGDSFQQDDDDSDETERGERGGQGQLVKHTNCTRGNPGLGLGGLDARNLQLCRFVSHSER
jgi:hypothetical protein